MDVPMKAAFLPDRSTIRVTGEDARHFLNNLVTAELDAIKPGTARFAALLTPQGKIVADFIVTEAPAVDGGGFLLDCPAALAAPLAARLGLYRLRAKLEIAVLPDVGVMAVWDGAPADLPDHAAADPRHPDMGLRILTPAAEASALAQELGATPVDADAYDAHRIACGVPRGGVDFVYGDAFPHETNMDRLRGVDFDKGCYIGQEVVSRMQHRGTARTRVTRLTLTAAPEIGVSVMAGDKPLGTMGSAAQGRGLALLRLDRLADALAAGVPITAGGVTVTPADPAEIAPTRQAAP
jgi:folate-binding protein YgfZ